MEENFRAVDPKLTLGDLTCGFLNRWTKPFSRNDLGRMHRDQLLGMLNLAAYLLNDLRLVNENIYSRWEALKPKLKAPADRDRILWSVVIVLPDVKRGAQKGIDWTIGSVPPMGQEKMVDEMNIAMREYRALKDHNIKWMERVSMLKAKQWE